jgi:hypothetical protein
LNRGAYTFARFAHGSIGQTDDRDSRNRITFATSGSEIDFDVYEVGINSIDCGRESSIEHVRKLLVLE